MNNYFLVKNLYDYEKVIAPPCNLPKNLKSVYVTDNDNNCKIANELGWDIVKKNENFINVTDKFEKRKSVSYINCFPLNIVPEIKDANFVFVCDSNIVRLWDEYINFVNSCSKDYCLFVTSGYYSGNRDNINSECNASISVKRWDYNKNQIKDCTEKYKKELLNNKIDLSKLSVVSAKYIGWNINHSSYNKISQIYYKECCKHLQGNVTLTYMSGLYKKDIYNFYTKKNSGGILNRHNYLG